jgi:type II secretory pathway component GspD/PulD (secretin)
VAGTQVVSIDVVIAERVVRDGDPPIDLSADDSSIVGSVQDLEKQGKLDVLFRARLSTLDQQPTSLHMGEQRPVAAGSTFGGGRGGAGGRPTTSYTYREIGTIIAVTPRITPNNVVVMDLNIERSRLVPAPPGDDPEGFVPSSVSTMTTNTTLSVPNGKTVIATGARDADANNTVILVTARIEPGVAIGRASIGGTSDEQVKVVFMKTAQARDASQFIDEMYRDQRVRVAPDERLNSVIIRATPAVAREIEALLEQLDRQAAEN